ncbi:Hypp75 [Branchiostoma lanceolatum]|uniref:Hypp75 protein n=1 Tax=Branchiostoma lanceolatum TaxID=7740 RepID=A0A8J9W1D7_BRALA|nr:Hypp75 [Branchiostoma lanceolatum]
MSGKGSSGSASGGGGSLGPPSGVGPIVWGGGGTKSKPASSILVALDMAVEEEQEAVQEVEVGEEVEVRAVARSTLK